MLLKGLFSMILKLSSVTFWQTTLLLAFVVSPLFADNNLQKQNQLTKDISTASKNLKSSKANSKKLRQKVIAAEDKLNTISRKLHDTESDINRLTTQLNKSNTSKKKLIKQTNQQKNALAQQMLALYTSGKQSHLRLLLKQDDPSDISRTIKYYEYMNKHRLKRIQSISKRLDKIKVVQIQINSDKKALKTLLEKQGARKQSLKKAVQAKEKALKKQHEIVVSNKKKLSKLRKEEQNLQKTIERLAKNEERERAKREKEKRKQAKLKIKTEKNRAAEKAKSIASKQKPKKKKAVKKEKIVRHYIPNKPFSKLKGKLSWPVRGSFIHKYNQTRNSKQKWKAVVIAAPGGTRVHAVARGKIEFSGRYKGYGYMVIIRHDNNYRSIYGYNRSVYKKAGDIVKAGEVIAAVGNTGSIKKNALYFEIRKKTSYQNPAIWCR